jgi:hypothetical protein
MSETNTTEELDTPAKVARAVLEQIRANRRAFDMASWMGLQNDPDPITELPDLPPEADPVFCGTTLCAAGWAAHLTGWTVGGEGGAQARKNGTSGYVPDVAEKALGLSSSALFYASNDNAERALEYIADGGDPERWSLNLGSAEQH